MIVPTATSYSLTTVLPSMSRKVYSGMFNNTAGFADALELNANSKTKAHSHRFIAIPPCHSLGCTGITAPDSCCFPNARGIPARYGA